MNITESSSFYNDLELMDTEKILISINQEDQKVAAVIAEELSSIADFIETALVKMKTGGRLFYIGAGTSGRLGVLDASECPPTFGVESGVVVGLIAGGDAALRVAQEGAEDNTELAWENLTSYQISEKDIVLGIASSGNTPYVLGGLEACKVAGVKTGALVCNPDSPIAAIADMPIEVIVGPEFVTGSTRMKAGTAQKMVLNMISTSIMIQLGKVKGNKMVDMKLSNQKLQNRGIRMIVDELGVSPYEASKLLNESGSVRSAIEKKKQITRAI